MLACAVWGGRRAQLLPGGAKSSARAAGRGRGATGRLLRSEQRIRCGGDYKLPHELHRCRRALPPSAGAPALLKMPTFDSSFLADSSTICVKRTWRGAWRRYVKQNDDAVGIESTQRLQDASSCAAGGIHSEATDMLLTHLLQRLVGHVCALHKVVEARNVRGVVLAVVKLRGQHRSEHEGIALHDADAAEMMEAEQKRSQNTATSKAICIITS